MQRNGYTHYSELDGYRGVAALMIVVFHVWQFSFLQGEVTVAAMVAQPGGWLFGNLEAGVAWFFVLSGFLLWLPFARAIADQGQWLSVRHYLARRAIRILPAYLVALLIFSSWDALLGQRDIANLVAHLTFTHVFHGRYIFATIAPAWSLACEVFYYLLIAALAPPLIAMARRYEERGTRLWLQMLAVSILILASLMEKWRLAGRQDSDITAHFGPLSRLDTFAIGMSVAVMVVACQDRVVLPRLVPAMLRVASVGVTIIAFLFRARWGLIAGLFHSLVGLGFAFLLASTVLGVSRPTWVQWLASPNWRWVGERSYGIYLIHHPLMLHLAASGILLRRSMNAFGTNLAVLVPIVVVAGWLSYRYIDLPARLLAARVTKSGPSVPLLLGLPLATGRTGHDESY